MDDRKRLEHVQETLTMEEWVLQWVDFRRSNRDTVSTLHTSKIKHWDEWGVEQEVNKQTKLHSTAILDKKGGTKKMKRVTL